MNVHHSPVESGATRGILKALGCLGDFVERDRKFMGAILGATGTMLLSKRIDGERFHMGVSSK